MRNFLATVTLSIVLVIGIGLPAHASSITETEAHFSWSSVVSKAVTGMVVAIPAVVYFVLNNRKED